MTVDNSLYREISCLEVHQLIPFSNGTTGAITTSRSKLELKGEESYSSGEFLAESRSRLINGNLKPNPSFFFQMTTLS